MKDGVGVGVVAVLGAGCCLGLPLLVALAASAALYIVGGLLVAAATILVGLLLTARIRRRVGVSAETIPYSVAGAEERSSAATSPRSSVL